MIVSLTISCLSVPSSKIKFIEIAGSEGEFNSIAQWHARQV